MEAQFSERTFETAFNAEYIERHRAFIIRAPYVPDLLKERDYGFDLQLKLLNLRPKHSIFFQHKRPAHIVKKDRRNADIVINVGRPFYRFYITPHQHRRLLRLDRKGHNVNYSVPRFHTSERLFDYFMYRQIFENTICIPAGSLSEDSRKCFYSEDGLRVFHKSSLEDISDSCFSCLDISERFSMSYSQVIDEKYFSNLADSLTEIAEEAKDKKRTIYQEYSPLIRCFYLLSRYFRGLTWYISTSEIPHSDEIESDKLVHS